MKIFNFITNTSITTFKKRPQSLIQFAAAQDTFVRSPKSDFESSKNDNGNIEEFRMKIEELAKREGEQSLSEEEIEIFLRQAKDKQAQNFILEIAGLTDKSGKPRFKLSETWVLFSIARIDNLPDLVMQIAKLTDKNERPRFNTSEIDSMVEVAKDQNAKNEVLTFAEMADNEGRAKFDVYGIDRLIELFKNENLPEFVMRLARLADDEGKTRFSCEDIETLVKLVKNCASQEFVSELAELENPQKRPLLDVSTITKLTRIVKAPDAQKSLIKLAHLVNDENKPILNIGTIVHILGKKTNNSELDELADMLSNFRDEQGNKLPQEIFFRTLAFPNYDSTKYLLENYKKLNLGIDDLTAIFRIGINDISIFDIKKMQRLIIQGDFKNLQSSDLALILKFIDLYDKESISEIPRMEKRRMLQRLVAVNADLFNTSDELKKRFPLLPKSQEEYCSLLPHFIRSMGIETKELTNEQIQNFNSLTKELATELAKIKDSDFKDLKITQEYSQESFIFDVLKIVESLPTKEQQKVCDYFGFELAANANTITKYSITGYPANLNNGKKLAQIKSSDTRAVIEELRPLVKRFSEKNHICCNNKQIEILLNKIIEVLPELRTMIGKRQHLTHAFDLMQHSLKVMQKIAQDERFEKLNESDKKVMLLAALMHDITKKEAKRNQSHAETSSFDTFFITKKLNLSHEEEIKLHTIIKQHEWLGYVNTSDTEKELTRRLQSVAYDLHQNNLFDLVEIFTHADLHAVNEHYHDTTEGKYRITLNGTKRSFGDSADIYAAKIREYIEELRKTQPLLPQTKMPKASRIEQAITKINEDGSTNIKGVYKDKDGLIIIKYNEVEDWEAIGFPKGSISRGIKTGEDIDTGNIKFFVHALVYPNQIAKFDAFALPNSDVLLSASYAERVDSKFRFFRPQGVILDVYPEYVHGGGETDAGSGFGKNIDVFKKNYILGGYKEGNRKFVSDLIKRATGMNDEEYIAFYENNKDKTLQELEPAIYQEQIINALTTMNSRTRLGGREYNEMYISNPKRVMGVFAYNMVYDKENVRTIPVGNPIEFLKRETLEEDEKIVKPDEKPKSVKERTSFLREYAIAHDIPFFIFGD